MGRLLASALASLMVAALLCSCHAPGSGGAHPSVKEISAVQLQQWMRSGRNFLLIDVRSDDEWQSGHAASAIHIRRVLLSTSIERVASRKDLPIVLYCLSGKRSASGVETLARLGYTQVYSLKGGLPAYQRADLPVAR